MNYAQKLSVCLLSIILSLVSVLAFAESYSTTDNRTIIRSGFQVQRFKGGNTDSGTQGLMVGYRSSRYLYKGFSLGIEAVAGAPQDGSIVDNNVFYTGLTLGWDQSFLKILTYEFDVLVGYGYGKSDNLGVSGDGFTIQPQVGLGFVLVNGYRLSFLPGYLYMPRTNGFSGFTFSLRLDRKAESLPGKAVND
ncbi:MAG: hypothetical protein EBQ85_08935 [Proteobacteria bacterium]|nr:hypothetical protein [Pseudomonadota bacterium]